MQKKLGGDRLGSGSKMNVDLHGYGRSTHDLGYLFRTTMSAGTLVPFLNEIALPGDSFDIDLDCDIKTHPTVGPLFGSYKVQLDVFQCPIRLYQGKLHNNKLGIGMQMAAVKLPQLELVGNPPRSYQTDFDNIHTNPSSILAYLGIRGIGQVYDNNNPASRQFNAVPFISYWDIYKNYYANKQEGIGMVVHTAPAVVVAFVTSVKVLNGGTSTTINERIAGPSLALVWHNSQIELTKFAAGSAAEILIMFEDGAQVPLSELGPVTYETASVVRIAYNQTVFGPRKVINWRYKEGTDVVAGEIDLVEFELDNLDEMRESILVQTMSGPAYLIAAGSPAPYGLPFVRSGTFGSIMESQEGLGIKTYQSDMFNNWMDTEYIDGANGINEITAIDTTDGSFQIQTFIMAKKVYDMLNRIAVSGGTYDDWLDVVYDETRYTRASSPMYMGGLIKELVFQEVISNTEVVGEGGSALGSLAGRGVLAKKHKGGQITIKVDEPSYIMGIVSLTPRIDYSQGNKWDVHLRSMDDLHKPGMDEIGFQDLITEQMHWMDTKQNQDQTWGQRSAGKQPAWLNYMTNVNVVRGNFAIADPGEMFMVLNRRYEMENSGDGNIGFRIADLTTYVDPRKYNHIFADTALDSQNFWTQISVDMKVRRKISARVMPNL